MTSHNATRNAHDVMWKGISWQRQRRTCYRVQYQNVAWCSIYKCLFELSSTTNISHCHLVHNKNTSPPTILEMYVSAQLPFPDLTETCFEITTLGEFTPDRSVCSVGGSIAAPATSYSRGLIEYMHADACFIGRNNYRVCRSWGQKGLAQWD